MRFITQKIKFVPMIELFCLNNLKGIIIMRKLLLVFTLLYSLILNAQTEKERKWARMHYMDKKYTESFNEFRHLSKFLNPRDLFILAQHYQYGQGTERSLNQAIKYYKLAADRGDDLSQSELCEILIDGKMIDSEQQKADLYKYSRMFGTNLEYSNSTNSATDKTRHALSLCYKNGWGTKKNQKLADIWLAFAAYNDSMDAQDELCEKLGIDGNYNSEEEELALASLYFKYLYEAILPYVQKDHSIEMSFFRINYLIFKQTPTDILESLKEVITLYENPKLCIEGKAVMFDLIQQAAKYNTEFKNKYAADAEKYELISDESKEAWQHRQLTKVVWKVDVMLNSHIKPIGISNGHEWVDLGLPSGTKWATCNIDAITPYDSGSMFAWAEIKQKRTFNPKNYIGGTFLLMDDDNDTAHQLYGSNWHVPSCENWRELFWYCDIEYDRQRNVIIAKSPNNQQLSIPLVQNSEVDGVIYWTNTCVLGDVMDPEEGSAISLLLDTDPFWTLTYADKWRGCPIRPIYTDNHY